MRFTSSRSRSPPDRTRASHNRDPPQENGKSNHHLTFADNTTSKGRKKIVFLKIFSAKQIYGFLSIPQSRFSIFFGYTGGRSVPKGRNYLPSHQHIRSLY